MSCADIDDPAVPTFEEDDHQKEYLEFVPVLWENKLQETLPSVTHWMQFHQNLLIYKDVLIVPANKDGIIALDQDTGDLLWHKPRTESSGFIGGLGIEVIGDILLCKGAQSTVALNPTDGSVIWEQYFESNYGDFHYIETNGTQLFKELADDTGYHIYQADIADGQWQKIYSHSIDDEIHLGGSTDAFTIDGKDYLIFTSKENCDKAVSEQTMYVLDVATSAVIWSDTYPSICAERQRVFTHNDQIIHYNNHRGASNVRALSVDNGNEIWKVDVPTYYQPFPFVVNDVLSIQGVTDNFRIDLTDGSIQTYQDITMGHTDIFERDGKLYYGGFRHFGDHKSGSGIGDKIAVVDKETMLLEKTILPHHRKNTTEGDEPYGKEIFDNDYSYVGRDMVFSADGKRIFITCHNEVLCLQLEEDATVIEVLTLD